MATAKHAALSNPPVRAQRIAGLPLHQGPGLSVGVPYEACGGLSDALHRDAEDRRKKQQLRERKEQEKFRMQTVPRVGEASRAMCRMRLERELREASECAGCQNMPIQRNDLFKLLTCFGLLHGGDSDEAFCSKLSICLDPENWGFIAYESLLNFCLTAAEVDNLSAQPSASSDVQCPKFSLVTEDPAASLEQQLLRWAGRLFANRALLHRSDRRPSSARRRAASASDVLQKASWATGAEAFADSPTAAAPAAQACWETPCAPSRARSLRKSRGQSTPQADEMPISRCHLLYYQAAYTCRESALKAQEVRDLREEDELRECTCRPQLTSARRPPSPCLRTPRNFETAVARMRHGRQQRMDKEAARERIPRGENYQRLRKMAMQPFSCYYGADKQLASKRRVLLYVDVNMGHGRSGRIGVHDGDDLLMLARNFARTFQLTPGMEARLAEMLQQAYAERQRLLEAVGIDAWAAGAVEAGCGGAAGAGIAVQGAAARQPQHTADPNVGCAFVENPIVATAGIPEDAEDAAFTMTFQHESLAAVQDKCNGVEPVVSS
eukprot:TRINITY_DN9511_c0_g1_i3.p1 TRINITY_DN9511_c0_g1~~TRINITY_DN9511_c0_g1_i3.p1  ORF type:complete len:553 (+),score=99.89 TRINITY_DN9511_c0_g1_i3:167-1825(+)